MRQARSSITLFLAAAALILVWGSATWVWEEASGHWRSLAAHLFWTQDLPAMMLALVGVVVGAAWVSRHAPEPDPRWFARPAVVGTTIVVVAIAVWAGQKGLFHGYALSRDEEVADMASAYMADGVWGVKIPTEWVPFRRAIMPEFFLPFGADHFFAAAYLPVNSAVRGLCRWLGDATLAGPMWMTVGLLATWGAARRLFGGRDDAVVVTLVMTLSSVQLLLTAMTPYAMTAHFALNMLWLALVLRDNRWSHGAAGLVAIATAGLHQWHFPLIFLLPFLPWFALQRRWGVMLFHGAMIVVAVVIWAKLWPAMMHDILGAPADVQPAKGVADKMGSLMGRLEKWHPLLHLSRFIAWNNVLLLPLAALGVAHGNWRAMLRGETPVLPLALGCIGAMLVTIDQGYGWGYRYLHGYIGALALLAGYGWMALRRVSLRVVGISVITALVTGSFLMARAREYVAPYARAHAMIHNSTADVVVVDPRGGRFVTDLVRGTDGDPLGRPVVMSLGMLTRDQLDAVCARKRVAIFDRSAFLPLGIGAVAWGDPYMASLRARMADTGCGRVLTVPRR